jgi:hypothetical protein
VCGAEVGLAKGFDGGAVGAAGNLPLAGEVKTDAAAAGSWGVGGAGAATVLKREPDGLIPGDAVAAAGIKGESCGSMGADGGLASGGRLDANSADPAPPG